MLAHPLPRSRPAMRRLARPRPIGAACLGTLLVLSLATIGAQVATADSNACLVGASATSLRPNTLEVVFAGCAYVVSAEVPPYTIDLLGHGSDRRLYQGDGAAPNTTSGDVTWTIGGLPAGTYQTVNSGVVGFDAAGNPVIGTGSLAIRVFGAQGTTPTPTLVPATPTPHPTVTASPTRTPQPTGTAQAKPSATAMPTRAPSPVPVGARATAAAAPRPTATAHPVVTAPATITSAPPSVAVTTAPVPAIATVTPSPAAPSGPMLPPAGASAVGVVAPTPPAPSPPASLVAAVAVGAHGPSDEGTTVPAGISTAARSSAVTGATLRLVLVLAGGLVALAVVVLGAVRSRRRRTAR